MHCKVPNKQIKNTQTYVNENKNTRFTGTEINDVLRTTHLIRGLRLRSGTVSAKLIYSHDFANSYQFLLTTIKSV